MTRAKSSKTAEAETREAEAVGESLYTAEELAAAAGTVFHTTPDLVTAALRVAGVTKTTQKEAARIVEAFRKREV